MRIVFLDFDGPLVTMASTLAYRSARALDPVRTRLVARACREAGARVVVSSVWRKHGRASVCADLEAAGFDLDFLHDDWCTDPDIHGRPESITEWMGRHPEVEAYVCVDDETFTGHPLVRVSSQDGFQLRHYIAVLDILGMPCSPHLRLHIEHQYRREKEDMAAFAALAAPRPVPAEEV